MHAFRSIAIIAALAATFSCATNGEAAEPLPKPERDSSPPKTGETRTAVFAAGCFWCVEAVFAAVTGVVDVRSGYAGGTKDSATYEKVSRGETKHAEAVQITYDGRTTYGTLLRVLFSTHDPTTKDRQGPDWGAQYRSAIFYANAEEKAVAEAYIAQLTRAKRFSDPIVTTLEPLDVFYPAEGYHQDFVAENPAHPYVRQWAIPKLKKLREVLPELVAR